MNTKPKWEFVYEDQATWKLVGPSPSTKIHACIEGRFLQGGTPYYVAFLVEGDDWSRCMTLLDAKRQASRMLKEQEEFSKEEEFVS